MNVHIPDPNVRIGVMSDSHGRIEITRRAVDTLVDRYAADLLIHLGDFETMAVIDELVGQQARLVFGNCDLDTDALRHHAECMSIAVDHPLGWLSIGSDVTVAFTHGHLPHVMQQALSERVDWLLHGHTHETRDEQVGPTRIVNPGALFRAARYTVALIEPVSGTVEFIEVTGQRRREK